MKTKKTIIVILAVIYLTLLIVSLSYSGIYEYNAKQEKIKENKNFCIRNNGDWVVDSGLGSECIIDRKLYEIKNTENGKRLVKK